MKKTSLSNPNCNLCSLCETANTICVPGSGKISSKSMVISDFPGYSGDLTGKNLSGSPGKLFDKILSEYGFDRSNFFITNAIKCNPPEGSSLLVNQIKACKTYLVEEIERIKPKHVLLLGANTLKVVLGKAKITEIHGNIIERDGIKYLPTFHPAMAIRDPKRLGPIRVDIKKFLDLSSGKIREYPHKLNYRVVKNIKTLSLCIDYILKSTEVSFDLETTGLNRFEENSAINILGIATSYQGNRQWIIPLSLRGSSFRDYSLQKKIIITIKKSLEKRVIGSRKKREIITQNGKFDNLWLKEIYGIRFPITFDTMLASSLIDENSPAGLKYRSKVVLGAEDWDIDNNSKVGGDGLLELKKLYKYAAWDVYFTLELYYVNKRELINQEGLSVLNRKLVVPVAKCYESIESNGVYLDINRLKEVKREVNKKIVETEKELNRYIKPNWNLQDINWNSHQQVGKVLFKYLKLKPEGYTPKGEPSTAEDFINRMSGHPILRPLIEYRKANKTMSTFIEGWEKRMVNRRWLHPSYKVDGTVTGRPSCSNPNFQQVPRDPMIRSLVSAPPGWIAFEADYSQVELRIAAHLAEEREMIRVFLTNGDIHRETASSALGKDPDDITKDDRKKAKAINFGFIYGMGYLKFMDYSRDKYGVIVTKSESRGFRTRYFERYSDLPAWHEKQRRIVRSLGQVRTLTGRIRHLPEIDSPDEGVRAEAERNAINSPVQGFGAELTLMSQIDIHEVFSPDELKVYGTVHDATLGMVREELAIKHLKRLKEIMERPSLMDLFNINLLVPLVVDVSIGNWGSGKELKF